MFNSDEDISLEKIKQFFSPIKTITAIRIITCIGIVVFFNALFGGFVNDDILQIVTNPAMHSVTNIPSFFINTTIPGAVKGAYYYRPLLFATYDIFYSLFGNNTFFYHLFQIGLHILNACFVYILFEKFFHKRLSLVLAILFLVHPMTVESVSLITNVQDTLYFFFGIVAWYISQRNQSHSIRAISLISLCLVLSLFSKETGSLFICMVVLYAFLYSKKEQRNIAFFGSVIAVVLYTFFRFFVARNHAISSSPNVTLITTNIFTAPDMLLYYLRTFFFPNRLSIVQQWLIYKPTLATFYFPLLFDVVFFLLIGGLGILVWKNKKKYFHTFLFFCAWFVVGLLPALPLWLLDMTVADRWFYFPLVGLLGLLGLTVSLIKITNLRIKLVVTIGIILLICVLSIRTMVRNTNFSSNVSLYQHDAPLSNNYTIYSILMTEYLQEGNYTKAKDILPIMIHLNPNEPKNTAYKGIIDEGLGAISQAKQDFVQLLNSPDDIIAFETLPALYVRENNDYAQAGVILKRGIAKYPQDGVLWHEYAIVEYKLGNIEEANRAAAKIGSSLQVILSGQ